MKKRLFILFSLLFVCLFANTKDIFAKDVSKLCEYDLTDYNLKFSFQLYSKDGGDNFIAKNALITLEDEEGKHFIPASNASVIRYWEKTPDKFDDNDTWAIFNTRKSCNKYVAFAQESNESYSFALFDDATKGKVIYTGSKYQKYYSVKTTDNYVYTGSPLQQEFVGNLTCGNSAGDKEVIRFHKNLPTFTSRMYDLLKILTPVIIIITGMLDIIKAVTAQKEDEMKKAQKKFVNRLIAGSVVFLVFVIVEFVITFVAESETTDAMNCVNCFINGDISTNGCTDAP